MFGLLFIHLSPYQHNTHTHTLTSLTWCCAEDERWSLVGPADVVLRLDEQLVVGVGPEAVEGVVHHGRIAVVLHDVVLVLSQRLLDLPRVRHNLHLTMQVVSFKYTAVFHTLLGPVPRGDSVMGRGGGRMIRHTRASFIKIGMSVTR